MSFNLELANEGTFILNGTVEKILVAKGIFVLEDTVFASIKNENGNDITDNLIQVKATAVKAGTLITPTKGESFNAITLTSGSVVAIIKNN